jgi:hypothetical protein
MPLNDLTVPLSHDRRIPCCTVLNRLPFAEAKDVNTLNLVAHDWSAVVNEIRFGARDAKARH